MQNREQISVTGTFRDVASKAYFADPKATRLLNRMMDQGGFHRVEIPIARLIATQPYVNPDFRDAAKKIKGDGFDLPAVVKYDGRYYVADGHHRLMSAAVEGKACSPVRLYDLDGDTQLDFPLLDGVQDPFEAPEPEVEADPAI